MRRQFSSGSEALKAFGSACALPTGMSFIVQAFGVLLVAAIAVILRIEHQDNSRGSDIDRSLRDITGNE